MSDPLTELIRWMRENERMRITVAGIIGLGGAGLILLDLTLPTPLLLGDYLRPATYFGTIAAFVVMMGDIAFEFGRKEGLAAATKAALEEHERHQNRVLSRVMGLEGEAKATFLWFMHQLTRESWVDGRDLHVIALVDRQILVPVPGEFTGDVRPFEVPKWLWEYLVHIKTEMAEGIALRPPIFP